MILPGIMKRERKYEKLTTIADGRRTLLDAKNPHGILPRLYGYSIFYFKKTIYFANLVAKESKKKKIKKNKRTT